MEDRRLPSVLDKGELLIVALEEEARWHQDLVQLAEHEVGVVRCGQGLPQAQDQQARDPAGINAGHDPRNPPRVVGASAAR